MLKSIGTLIVCLCLIGSVSVPAFAANKVSTIDMEAVLYKDGSMYVSQVWEGDFDEGTEIYIPMNAPSYLTISDLQVSDLGATYEVIGELMGLKRYLEDFSLVAERGVKEMPIWQELLTYAMLFGIADQVAEQMKELYPQISDQLTDYSQSLLAAYSYHYLLYKNMKEAEDRRKQESRNDGGGGFASLGGGSGSMGGGSGGGTR